MSNTTHRALAQTAPVLAAKTSVAANAANAVNAVNAANAVNSANALKAAVVVFAAIAVLLALPGCNIVNNLIHDDNVVAKAGGQKLYRSTLSSYIPDGMAPADSARLAQQYIRSWASEAIFLRQAERELSKAERDVSKELEEYRKSLLRYRYEQQYINDRLDTTITEAQIKEYYEAHKETFNLERPIVKMRFVSFFKDSPYREEIMDKLPAKGGSEQRDLDSLAYLSALRYIDHSAEWTDAAVLAREFGTDWETMLSQQKNNYIVIEGEDVRAAYIFQSINKGVAPLDFCATVIRDNILSARKRGLLEKLEQDLLTVAEEKKDFVIYGE